MHYLLSLGEEKTQNLDVIFANLDVIFANLDVISTNLDVILSFRCKEEEFLLARRSVLIRW